MTEYLPGTTGERITELREEAGLTIEELATTIGINATTLGRIEKGQTQKVGDDVLTALAQKFCVSTDFLLGLTIIPDRKNYDITFASKDRKGKGGGRTERVWKDCAEAYANRNGFCG